MKKLGYQRRRLKPFKLAPKKAPLKAVLVPPAWLLNGTITLVLIALIFVVPQSFGYTWGFVKNSTIEAGIDPKVATTFAGARPPSILSIDGERWMVWAADLAQHDALGMTDCGRRIIWYDPNQKGVEDARDTLWHEIAHAFECREGDVANANWREGLSPSHEKVTEFAMHMTVFMHDNPEFIKWAQVWN